MQSNKNADQYSHCNQSQLENQNWIMLTETVLLASACSNGEDVIDILKNSERAGFDLFSSLQEDDEFEDFENFQNDSDFNDLSVLIQPFCKIDVSGVFRCYRVVLWDLVFGAKIVVRGHIGFFHSIFFG